MSDSARIESDFDTLLHDPHLHLTDDERAEVQHLIDVGEYGVALETLCEILKERAAPIASAAYSVLKSLGELMQFDPAAWGLSEAR